VFGLCAPAPNYSGRAQPAVLAPSAWGLLDMVTGFFSAPAPTYVGRAQTPPQTQSLWCSLLSPAQPVYKRAVWDERYPQQHIAAPTRNGAEGR